MERVSFLTDKNGSTNARPKLTQVPIKINWFDKYQKKKIIKSCASKTAFKLGFVVGCSDLPGDWNICMFRRSWSSWNSQAADLNNIVCACIIIPCFMEVVAKLNCIRIRLSIHTIRRVATHHITGQLHTTLLDSYTPHYWTATKTHSYIRASTQHYWACTVHDTVQHKGIYTHYITGQVHKAGTLTH